MIEPEYIVTAVGLRVPERFRVGSFKLCRDEEIAARVVIFDAQNVRFAADLAVFDVRLAGSGRLIDYGHIPFPAGSALETRFHFLQDSTLPYCGN